MNTRFSTAKGKPTGSLRYRVVSIRTDTTGKKKKRTATTTVHLKSGFYDLSNLVLHQQDLTYTCRHDTTYTDGLGEINYEGLKSFRDRLLAPTGTPLAWPNQPTPGTALPTGGAVVQVSSPSVAIAKVSTTLKARKVLPGPVPVTVPAGTFRCYPVECQRELATAARADLVLKSSDGGRQVDFYDPCLWHYQNRVLRQKQQAAAKPRAGQEVVSGFQNPELLLRTFGYLLARGCDAREQQR